MKKITRREFIENSVLLSASTFIAGSASIPVRIFSESSFDLIIKNGTILDGSGKQGFVSDIGIKNDRIAAIESLTEASAEKIIDAGDLIVSPGFIDIHTHTDLGVLSNPKGESKIRQGVTLEVGGNCGGSIGPVGEQEYEKTAGRLKEKYNAVLKDRSFGAFLDLLEGQEFSINQANLLGLGDIRKICVGMDDRLPSADEMAKMKFEVEKAVEEGAVGVSTGLEYTPGSFASTDELIELCKVIPAKAKLYATHMRNEDNFVEEAVQEAIKIARLSNSRLQLSHLKASGKSNWHKADSILNMMDNAVKEGLEVHADRYTYVAYHTGLANMFPLWARDGGSDDFSARLKVDSLLVKMKEYADKKADNLAGEWSGVVISGIRNKEYEQFKGKSVKAISEILGLDPFETAVELLLNNNTRVSMVGFGMSETATEKILSHPRVMIASDASAHAPYPPMNAGIAHPRAYGTFPRAISKYVKQSKICALEEMIRKMTSMPAEKLHIKDRGRINKNMYADIVIFDYNKIDDKAVFTDSHLYPEGIPYVIVNGKVVIDNGEHTGALPGRVIRS